MGREEFGSFRTFQYVAHAPSLLFFCAIENEPARFEEIVNKFCYFTNFDGILKSCFMQSLDPVYNFDLRRSHEWQSTCHPQKFQSFAVKCACVCVCVCVCDCTGNVRYVFYSFESSRRREPK